MNLEHSPYEDTKIEGVKVLPLKKIPDERGAIIRGVRREQLLNNFGEVYFSKIYKDVIKGWHVHETLELNYICIFGAVKLVLHDLREKSKTFGQTEEIFLGEDYHALVHIPPGVANGTKSLTPPYAIICNIASEPHNSNIHYRHIDPRSGEIPYDWTPKDF